MVQAARSALQSAVMVRVVSRVVTVVIFVGQSVVVVPVFVFGVVPVEAVLAVSLVVAVGGRVPSKPVAVLPLLPLRLGGGGEEGLPGDGNSQRSGWRR
jgi:hypothetical protein